MLETTLTVSGVETAPGPGFATVTLAFPNCVEAPDADSCDEETKFVVSGVPFQSTWAPLTKRLPLTVSTNTPGATGLGLTEVR